MVDELQRNSVLNGTLKYENVCDALSLGAFHRLGIKPLVNFDLKCVNVHPNSRAPRLNYFSLTGFEVTLHVQSLTERMERMAGAELVKFPSTTKHTSVQPLLIFKQPCRTWPKLLEFEPNSQMSCTSSPHTSLTPALLLYTTLSYLPGLPLLAREAVCGEMGLRKEEGKRYGQRFWEFG